MSDDQSSWHGAATEAARKAADRLGLGIAIRTGWYRMKPLPDGGLEILFKPEADSPCTEINIGPVGGIRRLSQRDEGSHRRGGGRGLKATIYVDGTVIHLTIRQVGAAGALMATSPDLPGLLVAAPDLVELTRRASIVAQDLMEARRTAKEERTP